MTTPMPGWLAVAIRRWSQTYKQSAKQDRLNRILKQHGRDPDDEDAHGPQLVDDLVAVVEYLLVTKNLSQVLVESEVERFLALQRYGGEPASGWSVRIGPHVDVEIYADALRDIELQDLLDRFGFFDLHLGAMGRESAADEVAGLVEHVRQDLMFDGDEVDITWAHHGRYLNFKVRELEGDGEE